MFGAGNNVVGGFFRFVMQNINIDFKILKISPISINLIV